jgi:hypothetical protein
VDAISLLGSLLGVSFLSGMRLYSTVFALGLALRFDWIQLPPELGSLEVLAETPVLLVAGAIYLVEFVADKIPLVDTVWDAVHTFIRPLGGAILAAVALGPVDPVIRVTAFLICGSVALSGHTAKAATRVAVNHSPEPFTNIAVSVAEDVLVAVGLWLAVKHPVITFAVVTVIVAVIVWFVPKLLRALWRSARGVTAAAKTKLGMPSAGAPV